MQKQKNLVEILIRPVESKDGNWVKQMLLEEWGAETVVAHRTIFYPSGLPGFIAVRNEINVGLVTYQITDKQCEIITLNSWYTGNGIGSSLVQRIQETAQMAGCTRLFLVTTNNNRHAVNFYQHQGFHVCAIRKGEINISRTLKPGIPLLDKHGEPIVDEIELETFL